MYCYTESGIRLLNDTTKGLKNLNSLGIYLSKQTDPDALKVLKLIILASENRYLNKPFDINYVKKHTQTLLKEKYRTNETIAGNLSLNPQNIALELFEYILHNHKINLNIEPFDNIDTIFDIFVLSFIRIENPDDIFYKRYDMIDKKLDIASYMLEKEMLNDEQVEYLLSSFGRVLERKEGYTEAQLQRIKNIVNIIRYKQNMSSGIDSLLLQNKITTKQKEDVEKLILPLKDLYFYEDKEMLPQDTIREYKLINDQCFYIAHTIPSLIRKKVIR